MRALPLRALALSASLAAACGRKGEVPAAPAPSAPPAASASSGAELVAGVLASVRARISLAAPAWQAQPQAFGRHLFVRVVDVGVEAYSVPDFERVMLPRLDGPRGVVELAGGSIVAVGQSGALRVDPGAKAPVRLPPVPWLPGTLLLPERRDSSFLWAAQTVGKGLVRQRLDLDPTRSFDKSITLEDYDGGPLTALRDGALVYRAEHGVRRALPENHPRTFASDLVPWRLLPGRRVDQAWAVAADGRVELWQLGERLLVQARFAAGAAPFDAAANADYLALVVLDEPGNAARAFRLLVFQNDGTRALERALPPGPPETGENWAEIAVRDRYVALSETDPVVAVGGPGRVLAFRLPGGEPLLER